MVLAPSEKEVEEKRDLGVSENSDAIDPSAGADMVEHVYWHDEEEADEVSNQPHFFDASMCDTATGVRALASDRRSAENSKC